MLKEITHTHQSQLANFCRSGVLENIPGIRKDNITHYRKLVVSIINEMLQNAFPLTYDLLTETEWENAFHDFLKDHSCKSVQVWQIAEEFYEYLLQRNHPLLYEYPFLENLLRFEWTELKIFMMEDKFVDAIQTGNIYSDKLVLNPESELHFFEYPVHLKSAGEISAADKGNYFVFAHRNDSGDVIFTEVHAGLARMLEYLSEESLSIQQLIQKLNAEFNIDTGIEEREFIYDFFNNAGKIK